MKVDPDRGIIMPGEKERVTVTVIPKSTMDYDTVSIPVTIRGNKGLACKLSGESVIPVIELEQTTMSMPTIAVGSEFRSPMVLTNKSTISASCVLDLKKYPDFKPSICPSLGHTEVTSSQRDSKGNSITLIEDKSALAQGQPVSQNQWKVTLAPGSTLEGSIVFAPSLVKTYNFKLGLAILGMENANNFNCQVTAASMSSRLGISSHTVEFGDRVVSRDPLSRASYFMEVMFKNLDNSKGFSYEIREAADDNPNDLIDEGRPPTFFISPVRGDIAPLSQAPIRVTFQPQESGHFSKRLEVFITDQPSPKIPYFTIWAKGSGVFPRLSFSSQHVEMPTVPLDVTSRAQFEVINNGYPSLSMNYKVSPAIPVPLDVTFPNGNEVGINCDRIKVVVSCNTNVPCAWSGTIEFSDEDGEKFSVGVSGCADNSIMTNYNFVKNYTDKYGFLGLDGQPTNYLTKTMISRLRAEDAKKKELLRKQRTAARQNKTLDGGGSLSSDASSSKKSGKKKSLEEEDSVAGLEDNEGVDLEQQAAIDDSCNEEEARFVLKWLNRNVMALPFDEERFPECILETHGDLAVTCVEQLSGKKIVGIKPGLEDIPSPSSGTGGSRAGTATSSRGGTADTKHAIDLDPTHTNAVRLLKKYHVLFAQLSKAGALLTHVNPIDLLSDKEHMSAQETHAKVMEGSRFTPSMLADRGAVWKREWSGRCKKAWLEVLFQSIKVYALGRVNYPEYCKMPGVSAGAAQEEEGDKKKKNAVPAEFSRSNIYSQPESILLAWITQHVNKASELKDEGAEGNISDNQYAVRTRCNDYDSDLNALTPFLKMIHSHMPDAAMFGGQLVGYTALESGDIDGAYEKLENVLNDVRLMFDVTDAEIACTSRTLLLMALHLFLNLPSLIQKAKIEFAGVLGAPIKKTIELRNPSRKPVTYNVTLQGSSDFVLSQTEVTVPPMSSADYLVILNARFFDTVSAKITFWGVREGGVAGKTIVFGMYSNITGRKPLQSITHKLSLFEFGSLELAIANPFPRDSSVPIKFLCHHSEMNLQEAMSGQAPVNKSGAIPCDPPANEDGDEDYEIDQNFNVPFWSTEDAVQLTSDGVKHLQVNMLPFMMGLYTCHLVLLDPNFGEYCYEVLLEVGLPKPAETLSFQAFKDGSTAQKLLKFSSKNYPLDKAITTLTDTRMNNSSRKGKARQFISNILASPLDDEVLGLSSFNLSCNSPYFQLPKDMLFLSEYSPLANATAKPTTGKKVSRTAIEDLTPQDNPNSLSTNGAILNFGPDKAGTYNARCVLHSKFNRFDLRIFDIGVSVIMPSSKLLIEFRGPAQHKLTQEIPVMNESDKDWNLTCNVSGKGFSGPKSLVVGKRDKANFTVAFTGSAPGTFEGSVILKNSEGQDVFDYTLVGVSEEPLAQDHLHFKCKARNRQDFNIFIKPGGGGGDKASPTRDAEAVAGERKINYNVQTDLQYVAGEAVASIPAASGGDYNFSVMCPVGGVMSGSITFTDPSSGNIVWYTIDVEVTTPLPESTIEVEAMVRSAVGVELELENPTNEDLVFTVTTEGDGLIADPTFTLPPGNSDKSVPYELIYSPLLPGDLSGKVSFYNDTVGEFWYRLHLVATESPPTVVPMVESMLGISQKVEVPIENPLSEEVTLSVDVSDPEHFFVNNNQITLAAYAQTTFDLFFRPSSLGEVVTADMVLSDPNFGEIRYNLSGKGLMPGVMEPFQIVAPLNEFGSHTIAFRNPFSHPLPIEVILDEPRADDTGEDPAFGLLLRKAENLVIPPKAPLQISISFSPKQLGQYEAQVQIRTNVSGRSLLWCYPMTGMAEAGTPQYIPVLQTACKTTLIRDVDLYLNGLRAQDMEEDNRLQASDFNVEIVGDKNVQQITRAFRVQPLELRRLSEAERTETEGAEDAEYAMKYRLIFEPLRSFASQVELVVECKNRGRWRAQVELEAGDPEADDVIALVAPVGGSDQVKFRLSNRFLGFSNFNAYFMPKSSPHFTVSPPSGVLAPYGSDGSEFVITFKPVTYGIREVAYLTIVTDDAQWNYEVVGDYPDTTVDNSKIQSKVDNKR